MRSVAQGLRTGAGASQPTAGTASFRWLRQAGSSQLSLPSVTEASVGQRCTTVASNGDW